MAGQKITVIIPTRDRCGVFEKSLKTVTSQDYDNLEIIVSDNFSEDNTREVVRRNNDGRIKYVNTGESLSMSRSWEFALSHVSGGWVGILGDDDGIFPGAFERISEISKATGVKAIMSQGCTYLWPSVTGEDYGELSVHLRSGCEVRDSKTWQLKVISGYYGYPELPMLYNGGFAHMSVINSIRKVKGSFFRSSLPDVYSAMAISSFLKKYAYSYDPLVINGVSMHSTGMSIFYDSHKDSGSPFHKILSEDNIPFHQDLPLFPDGSYPMSIQAMAYESYLQSRFLRNDDGNSEHKRQLELILAKAGKYQKSMEEWGRLFANKQGLNFNEIKSKAVKRKIKLRLASLFARTTHPNIRFGVGGPEYPIRDIYEASVSATGIRDKVPSKFVLLNQQVKRLCEKFGIESSNKRQYHGQLI